MKKFVRLMNHFNVFDQIHWSMINVHTADFVAVVDFSFSTVVIAIEMKVKEIGQKYLDEKDVVSFNDLKEKRAIA